MSSFFFERQEIHCSCFDTSPKNGSKIFKADPNPLNSSQNKQTKQLSARTPSEQGKNKKKSLKKQRNHSFAGSEKDPKQKEQPYPNILIHDMQPIFGPFNPRKQQRITVLDSFDQPAVAQIKSQQNKAIHIIRSQKNQTFFEPANFESSYKAPNQPISVQIHSQRKILDDAEFDLQITKQFQKDFKEFKLQMDMIQPQPSHRLTKPKNKEMQPNQKKFTGETNQHSQIQLRIRYINTQKIISIAQKQKTPQRAISFRNSAVSDRQNPSIKKQKNKMYPKQIESEKGSNSGSSSGRESVFLGRGFDGLTQKRESLGEIELKGRKEQKTNLETMVTQESHIKNSQIKTMTEYSQTLTSPKSQQNIGLAFGGGNKYGVAGMSYQDIGEMRGPKLTSLRKVYF